MNDPKQLLGIKGASETSSIWKLRIQLMKPITWIPLIWGVICGAAASGNFEWTFSNVLASLACMLMSGPLLAGYTQTINDFFDKEIDAINEPNRPIPSGKISIKDVKIQIWVLLIAGLIVAFLLDLYAKHKFPSVLLLALGWLMKDNSLHHLVNLINEKYDVKILGLASPLNFKSSKYKELKDYELGHVKEGVGAGGISLLAFLDGFKNEEIVSLCQQNLEIMKGLGQISLEKDC